MAGPIIFAANATATTSDTMTLSRAIQTLLLTLFLATSPCAQPRQWTVEIPDPARPGRVVTADVLAPQAGGPCAVAIIGHATLTACEHYRYLAEPLAESGWLVALPTTEDGMPGDQAALAQDMLLLGQVLRDGSIHLPPDLPAAAAGPFALLGHSLGGGAAVLAAAANPDVGALAVLAPQDRHRPSMIQQAPQVTAPALIVTGELDCVTPPADHHWPLYDALGGGCQAISVLEGGGHCGFAEAAEPCTGAEGGCPPLLDTATQRAVTATLVLPWLDWKLRGHAAAGLAFLAAAAAPGVATTRTGLPTAVAAKPAFRLAVLGPALAGGTARWALEVPTPVMVDAAVYDLQGRLVRRIMTGHIESGRRELVWQGHDRSGRRAAAGVYLLRVQAGDQVLRSRATLVD